MHSIELVYEVAQDTLLPRLRPESGEIPEETLRRWEEELASRQNLMQTGNLKTIRFQHVPRGFPNLFDVELTPAGDHRMRTIVLRSRDDRPAVLRQPRQAPRAEPVPAMTTNDWRQGFLEELQAFSQQLVETGTMGLGLKLAVEELQQVADQHPEQLTLLLLAGYLHVAERTCELKQDVQRLCYYVAACQLLSQAVGLNLPADTLPVPQGSALATPQRPVTQASQGLYAALWRLLPGRP